MTDKEKNKEILYDYVTRCKLMGENAYVDDAWLIDFEGDELCLDYTDFWVKKDVCPTNSYHMMFDDWKESLDFGPDKWLKVPDGVTFIRGGALKKNNLVTNSIKLDLNDIEDLSYFSFDGINWVEWVRGNNVKKLRPFTFRDMNYLKVLELESIDSHDLDVEYLHGLPDGCKVYLYDIQTTVKNLKKILFRYKIYSKLGRKRV